MKIITKNAIKSRKKAIKAIIFCIYCNLSIFFAIFLILIYFFVLPEIYRQAVKTINLRFFTPFFRNASRFTPFFVSHCGKFTVAQGQFQNGKFFAVNSKKRRKSENCRKSLMLKAKLTLRSTVPSFLHQQGLPASTIRAKLEHQDISQGSISMRMIAKSFRSPWSFSLEFFIHCSMTFVLMTFLHKRLGL